MKLITDLKITEVIVVSVKFKGTIGIYTFNY